MSDHKTWLGSIRSDFPDKPWIQEGLINEAQRTHFVAPIPDDLAFLRGAFVDLGFEKLGLPPNELAKVRLAFVGNGVAVPDTTIRLRNIRSGLSVVEAAEGDEQATLPVHWREGVLVIGRDDKNTWIGKKIPNEWIAGLDMARYRDAGDGWVLRSDEPEPPTTIPR